MNNNLIEKLTQIVENKQYAKINGTTIDLTTANIILSVYNQINDKNKALLLSKPLNQIISICYKLLSK